MSERNITQNGLIQKETQEKKGKGLAAQKRGSSIKTRVAHNNNDLDAGLRIFYIPELQMRNTTSTILE